MRIIQKKLLNFFDVFNHFIACLFILEISIASILNYYLLEILDSCYHNYQWLQQFFYLAPSRITLSYEFKLWKKLAFRSRFKNKIKLIIFQKAKKVENMKWNYLVTQRKTCWLFLNWNQIEIMHPQWIIIRSFNVFLIILFVKINDHSSTTQNRKISLNEI